MNKKFLHFKRVDGKYILDDGRELTTDQVLKREHYIFEDDGFVAMGGLEDMTPTIVGGSDELRLIISVQRWANDGLAAEAPPNRYHVTHGGSEVSMVGFRTVWRATRRTVAKFITEEGKSYNDCELMVGEIFRFLKDDGYEFTPFDKDTVEMTVSGRYVPDSEVF